MLRLRLIAEREIAAYVGVPSFWAALMMGPLLMLVAALVGNGLNPARPAPPREVQVVTADPEMSAAAQTALRRAAQMEHRKVVIVTSLGRTPAGAGSLPGATILTLEREGSDGPSVRLSGAPLPAVTVEMLREDLGQSVLRRRVLEAGGSAAVLAAADAPPLAIGQAPVIAEAPADPGRFGRFSVMMLLWMNLIGALGMLLQAIVRERANRALESLLSAARPSEIVFGKLAGVGALSLLVLSVWLAAGAAIAATPIGSAGAGAIGFLLQAFSAPGALVRAAVIYALSFAMYGSALVGLGAIARDLPSAQNLSRPVFGVLLLVFFVALAQLSLGAQGLSWLVWLPLFTPFIMLLAPPGSLSLVETIAPLCGMAATTVLFGWLATRALTGRSLRFRALDRGPQAPPVGAA